MKERGILFSAPMVRAILDGRKTQTRRAIKRQPEASGSFRVDTGFKGGHQVWVQTIPHPAGREILWVARCPYGVTGDRLWARESWQLHERFTDVCRVVYAASAGAGWSEMHEDFPADLAGSLVARPFQEGWRPSIHMPRWASRITLDVTEVRIERLRDISNADAEAEGIQQVREPDGDGMRHWGVPGLDIDEPTPQRAYFALWALINGEDSLRSNPWVWAVTCPRVAQEARAA